MRKLVYLYRTVFGNLRTHDQRWKKIEKKKINYCPSVVIIDLFITINIGLRTKRAHMTNTPTNAREIKFHTRLLPMT